MSGAYFREHKKNAEDFRERKKSAAHGSKYEACMSTALHFGKERSVSGALENDERVNALL